MSASTKDNRILKWYQEGLSVQRIARKLGDPKNLARVLDALKRNNINPVSFSEGAPDA